VVRRRDSREARAVLLASPCERRGLVLRLWALYSSSSAQPACTATTRQPPRHAVQRCLCGDCANKLVLHRVRWSPRRASRSGVTRRLSCAKMTRHKAVWSPEARTPRFRRASAASLGGHQLSFEAAGSRRTRPPGPHLTRHSGRAGGRVAAEAGWPVRRPALEPHRPAYFWPIEQELPPAVRPPHKHSACTRAPHTQCAPPA
jgi:hypothetical protein